MRFQLSSFSACNSFFRVLACACLLLPATLQAQQAKPPAPPPPPIANFTDIAEKAGLTAQNIFGGLDTKKYIIETTGTGVAIFDYDNDGWPDIFLVNGTKLEGFPAGTGPSNRLYRNNHDGTFTDVTAKAGLTATGWGQGVCVGDYDNDGWEDLYITYYGKNRLYHNQTRSLHRSRRESPASRDQARRGARVARSSTTTATAASIWSWRIMWISIWQPRLRPAIVPPASGRAFPSCAVRADCPARRTFSTTIAATARLKTSPPKRTSTAPTGTMLSASRPSISTKTDGPIIFIACDSTPSILYRNNHDGTFTDVAVTSGAAFNEDGREQAGMGSTIADYNGDGHLDIFKTNFSDDTSTLYKNNGDGTFTDATSAAGLGPLHAISGMGNHVFRHGQRRLAGFDSGERPRLSRSRQPAPGQQLQRAAHSFSQQRRWNVQRHFRVGRSRHYDRGFFARAGRWRSLERRQDFGCHQQHERPAQPAGESDSQCESLDCDSCRRNEIESRRHRRTHSREDRSAILVDEVRSGSSYISNSDMRVHFGLGSAAKIEWVEIRWPSGLTERFANLAVDQIHTLKEGSGVAVEPDTEKAVAYFPVLGFLRNCMRAIDSLAFFHEDHLVHFHVFQRIDLAAGPANLEHVDFLSLPRPK